MRKQPRAVAISQLQRAGSAAGNSTEEIAAKEAAYRSFWSSAKTSRLAHAADLLVGAYLLPKREASRSGIPTSATLYLTLLGDALPTGATSRSSLPRNVACAVKRACCTGRWPFRRCSQRRF
jgi:hypothetical protein